MKFGRREESARWATLAARSPSWRGAGSSRKAHVSRFAAARGEEAKEGLFTRSFLAAVCLAVAAVRLGRQTGVRAPQGWGRAKEGKFRLLGTEPMMRACSVPALIQSEKGLRRAARPHVMVRRLLAVRGPFPSRGAGAEAAARDADVDADDSRGEVCHDAAGSAARRVRGRCVFCVQRARSRDLLNGGGFSDLAGGRADRADDPRALRRVQLRRGAKRLHTRTLFR